MKFLLLFICLVIGGTTSSRLRRMVGGYDIEITEVPYQVSIKVDDYHICGGALISNRHVLTAAHCVENLFVAPYDDLTVVTGSASLKKGGETHNVKNVTWHDGFINGLASYWINDIAILTLEDEVKENKNQKIVFLPTKPTPMNATGIVSGFGRTAPLNAYPSPILKAVKTRIVPSAKCQELVDDRKIIETQICGLQAKGIGICNGDSGGPLVFNGTVVGIASWNQPCGKGYPDVYTDVYDYIDFIKVTSDLNGSGASRLRNISGEMLNTIFLIFFSVLQPLFFHFIFT